MDEDENKPEADAVAAEERPHKTFLFTYGQLCHGMPRPYGIRGQLRLRRNANDPGFRPIGNGTVFGQLREVDSRELAKLRRSELPQFRLIDVTAQFLAEEAFDANGEFHSPGVICTFMYINPDWELMPRLESGIWLPHGVVKDVPSILSQSVALVNTAAIIRGGSLSMPQGPTLD